VRRSLKNGGPRVAARPPWLINQLVS
jgi:hypothetical protein